MDKKLIERIALEVARDLVFPGFEIDDVMASALTKYASAFLARIDAERGKDAVAFRMIDGDEVEYNGIDQFSCGRTGGDPLFLSPTIPEGMALVPIEPTTAMIYAGINTPVTDTGDEIADRPDDYRAVWKSMISAAQGERNAD